VSSRPDMQSDWARGAGYGISWVATALCQCYVNKHRPEVFKISRRMQRDRLQRLPKLVSR